MFEGEVTCRGSSSRFGVEGGVEFLIYVWKESLGQNAAAPTVVSVHNSHRGLFFFLNLIPMDLLATFINRVATHANNTQIAQQQHNLLVFLPSVYLFVLIAEYVLQPPLSLSRHTHTHTGTSSR